MVAGPQALLPSKCRAQGRLSTVTPGSPLAVAHSPGFWVFCSSGVLQGAPLACDVRSAL